VIVTELCECFGCMPRHAVPLQDVVEDTDPALQGISEIIRLHRGRVGRDALAVEETKGLLPKSTASLTSKSDYAGDPGSASRWT
jgi:hypothetical protein